MRSKKQKAKEKIIRSTRGKRPEEQGIFGKEKKPRKVIKADKVAAYSA